MDHSVTARYAGRPTASFVRRHPRAHAIRLGLRPAGSFRSVGLRSTVLQASLCSPVDQLRGGRRPVRIVASRHPASGVPGPAVVMHWTRAVQHTLNPGSSDPSSPWRG